SIPSVCLEIKSRPRLGARPIGSGCARFNTGDQLSRPGPAAALHAASNHGRRRHRSQCNRGTSCSPTSLPRATVPEPPLAPHPPLNRESAERGASNIVISALFEIREASLQNPCHSRSEIRELNF